MEKRFALFAFDTYYPAGGFNDFVGIFESYRDAEAFALTVGRNHHHVVDMLAAEVVTPDKLAKVCAAECVDAISEGWGREEDYRVAAQIEAIIAKYL